MEPDSTACSCLLVRLNRGRHGHTVLFETNELFRHVLLLIHDHLDNCAKEGLRLPSQEPIRWANVLVGETPEVERRRLAGNLRFDRSYAHSTLGLVFEASFRY